MNVHLLNRTKKAIQYEFELPKNYIVITSDEMEYITGSAPGDHWDFVSNYSTLADFEVMLATGGIYLASGVSMGLILSGSIIAAPLGVLVGGLTTQLGVSMIAAADTAYTQYYKNGKVWSLWKHMGWFGLVLDGFEVRAQVK